MNRALVSSRSARWVASLAARAGLPVACRIAAGSPNLSRPDRASAWQLLAIRPSRTASPATAAPASPGGAPIPRAT